MIDSYGRSIDYLRISVTDRCNLRCQYCMPQGGVQSIPHQEILTLEELLRLCRLFASLGVRKIKVTGGEPLVRKQVASFIGHLKEIDGIEQVTLTSNGLALERCLPELQAAGLDGINISLDTIRREVFTFLTGTDGLPMVLSSLQKAIESGIPVKINCVPILGMNEEDIVPIASFAQKGVKAVRFIELMPMGLACRFQGLPSSVVQELLKTAYGPLCPSQAKLGNGPAQYYKIAGFHGQIGFIDPMSHRFCQSCNRLRLTANGRLKLCLAHEAGADLKELLRDPHYSDEQILIKIKETVWAKTIATCF